MHKNAPGVSTHKGMICEAINLTAKIEYNISFVGNARFTQSSTINNPPDFSSISPTSGSLNGGTSLELRGKCLLEREIKERKNWVVFENATIIMISFLDLITSICKFYSTWDPTEPKFY